MDIKDTCFNCQATRKELEESKQKHMLDFKTIKEKIISTDKLIKLYQGKCQEFDKQTKYVVEVTTKLEGSHRNIDVIRLQLNKSLELNEPLQKTSNELKKENQLRRDEMQKLQDRLRGSENLISQLKNALKEKEKAAGVCKLDMTIQEQEIDGQKKKLKKNEILITKLKEQVSEEKREKKNVNKQLTLAQNRLNKMENQAEESKKVIGKITHQLHQAKQASNAFDKVHNFIKSPSPPKRLRKTRNSFALEQQKDADELTGMILIDEINYLLSLSPCPSLSPLPPSPCPHKKDDDDIASEDATLVNDDLDCIDGDDGGGGDGGDDGGDDDGVDDGVGNSDGVGDGDGDSVADDGDGVGDDGVGDGVGNSDGVGDGDGDSVADDGDGVGDGADDDANDADIQLGDNMIQSENDEPAFTILKAHPSQDDPLYTADNDLTNSLKKSDTKSLSDCETNQDRSEKVPSDEAICVTSNQSPFLMALRSGRKRKLSTNLTQATDELSTNTEYGDIPKNRKHCKTENITEQKVFENHGTKKSRNDSDNDAVDHIINCTETKSSKTDSCSSFRKHTLPKASESSVATPSKITEELRQEVCACLKSLIDGVVVEETAAKDCRPSVEFTASCVGETNMQTEETIEYSEAKHTKARNDFYEASNCLNNVIEVVAKSLDAPKPPLGNNVRDVKENEETVVCSEVCLEETSATDTVETVKCVDLGVVDVFNTILERTNEEYDGSSIVCDLRREDNALHHSETTNVVETAKCVDLGVVDAFNTILDRTNEEYDGSSLVGDLRRDGNTMDQSETTNVVETTKCGDLGVVDAFNTILDRKSEENAASSSLVCDLRREDNALHQSETTNVVENTKCMDLGVVDAFNTILDRKGEENAGSSSLVCDLRREDNALHQSETTNVVETTKCMDLEVVDAFNTILDRKGEENAANSSLVCDLRREDNALHQSGTTNVMETTKCMDLEVVDAFNTILDRKSEEYVTCSLGRDDNSRDQPETSTVVETAKCVDLGVADAFNTILDGSSLVGDLRRDDNAMEQSQTVTDRVGREMTKTSDSDPSCHSDESLARIRQEFSANDTSEKALVIPEDDLTESCANESLTFTPVVSAPLSPIPDSLERAREIPSFELWDNFPPLSPIPPSPKELASAWNYEITDDDQAIKQSIPDESQPKEIANELPANPEVHLIPTVPAVALSNNLHDCVKSLSVAVDSTDRENSERSSKAESIDRKTPLVSTDPLDRSSNVSEHKYVLRLLTMLKNDEITSEEVTRRFLIIANLRAATPFASALLHILKGAQDDEEHALMEKFAEQHERGCEKALQPIITDFEMRVVVVIHNLSKRKQFLGLLRCMRKLFGNALCGLFRSEDNDSAVLAMCRMYTMVCRLMRDVGRIRVFCYDVIKENLRHQLTEKIIESVGLAWPGVLGKKDNSLKVFSDSVVLNGPPFQPLLSTLQVVIMARAALSDKTSAGTKPSRLAFQRLYGWAELPSGMATLEWLARDLVRTLCDSGSITLEMKPDFEPSMGSGAFESVKSLELLAVVLGWEWTNDVLIRELLWPVLQKWWKEGIYQRDGVKELEITEVENNDQTSAVVKNINSGLTPVSGVSHANRATLNGGQIKLKPISHSDPEIEVGSQDPSTNDVDTDLKSLKREAESPKASCLPDIELKTASEMLFANVNDHEESDKLLNTDETPRVVSVCSKMGERTGTVTTEVTIVSILRLLGLLGLVGLQKDGVNLDAMINLMCAILTCADEFEGVTFGIQLAAAYALINMLTEKPKEIFKVLNNWITQMEDETKEINLPPHFTRQIKYYRTHLFTKKS